MDNNINWMRNRVFDNNTPRQTAPSASGGSQASPPQAITAAPGPSAAGPLPDPSQGRNGPPPVMDPYYIPGFLSRNIGRNVRAEFIIGTNQFVDKAGRLLEVGVNFFVLEDFITKNHIMCDLYSVKFVTLLS
jgi:hypothetical protein